MTSITSAPVPAASPAGPTPVPGAFPPGSSPAPAASITVPPSLQSVLEENERRMRDLSDNFNPLTGYRSVGERQRVVIEGFPLRTQYLPVEMLSDPFVSDLIEHGFDSVCSRLVSSIHGAGPVHGSSAAMPHAPVTQAHRHAVIDRFFRTRYLYDFPFWAWMQAKIHPKGSGDDIPFRLNRPQRKLIEQLERMRKRGKPIRLVLLKARQWGGSTATQIYMAWLQLVVLKGANSIIVGHVKDASTEVKDMLTKLLEAYDPELVCDPYSPFFTEESEKLSKQGLYHGSSSSANIFYVKSRNAKFKLGTAEKPNSARGGDSTLAHCTEVGLWMATEGKTPEDIVTSVTGGISYKPNTMIVYESTAKGTGTFFHKAYTDAKRAELDHSFHQFERLFINWYEIGWKNMLPFKNDQKYLKQTVLRSIRPAAPVPSAPVPAASPAGLTPVCGGSPAASTAPVPSAFPPGPPPTITAEQAQRTVPWFDFYLPEFIMDDAPTIEEFAQSLIDNRMQTEPPSDTKESGAYLWNLWQSGATLQGIYWYICERTKYHDHADMASETPSDDIEAFRHSGAQVFSEYHIEQFRKGCKPPTYVGDVIAANLTWNPSGLRPGKEIFQDLKFINDPQGNLSVWHLPDDAVPDVIYRPDFYIADDETLDTRDIVTAQRFAKRIAHRYLVVVDIGGISKRADWSVVTVFDRYWMMYGNKPEVVAQWYGHIHHDLLAWKAAQIAKFYDNALLVIESNTLETRDKDRDVDGDASDFILNQIKQCYDNLYERTPDNENIIEGAPHKYGFHTNVKTKVTIILNLQHVIRECLYVERDERCLHEYSVYEKKQNGSYGAISGEHDDLLMTRAIGLYICFSEMPIPFTYTVDSSL